MPTQVMVGHSDTVVIAKETSARYGLLMILGPLVLLMVLTEVLGSIFSPESKVNSPTILAMTGVVGLISLVISVGNMGPCEIHLDPHTRRYRFISGLPLFVRTMEGPYEDIAAFVISPYYSDRNARGRNTTANKVEIQWAVPGRKTSYIRWLNLSAAYQVKDAIEKQAGLPLVWTT